MYEEKNFRLLFVLTMVIQLVYGQTPPTPTITVVGNNSVCPSPVNGLMSCRTFPCIRTPAKKGSGFFLFQKKQLCAGDCSGWQACNNNK